MRLVLPLVLLAVAAFCVYGFLATFEPVAGALAWRVGYGVAAVACLAGASALLRRRR